MVIKSFTTEILPLGSDSYLDSNPSNPYAQLHESERLEDLIDTFSLLLAETYRDVQALIRENQT